WVARVAPCPVNGSDGQASKPLKTFSTGDFEFRQPGAVVHAPAGSGALGGIHGQVRVAHQAVGGKPVLRETCHANADSNGYQVALERIRLVDQVDQTGGDLLRPGARRAAQQDTELVATKSGH